MSRVLLLAALAAFTLAACEDDGLGTILDASPGPAEAGTSPIDVGIDAGPSVDAAPSADAVPSPDAAPNADATPGTDAELARDALATEDSGTPPPTDGGQACDGGVSVSAQVTTDSSAQLTGVGPPSTMGELVVTSTGGDVLRLPLTTDGAGTWSVEVPLFCGQQTVVVSFPGQVCGPTTQIDVQRTNCRSPDLQVTLSWDAIGLDFELHLIRPGGRINDNTSDCTWTSCINASPDWGRPGDATDNPRKDVDNVRTFGPENIYLSFPEAGLYTVLVEHWGAGGADADGEVTILLRGQPPVRVPITDLPSRFVRSIATIDAVSGVVTPLSAVLDCNANWASGCREPIP